MINNAVRLNDMKMELKSPSMDSVLIYVTIIIVENDNTATNRQRNTIFVKNKDTFKFTNFLKTINLTKNVEIVIVN